MGDRIARQLVSTDTAALFDVDCHAPQSSCGHEELVETTQIILPRRGVFGLTRHGRKVIAEPTSAVVMTAGTTYQVDHPSPYGDRCTVLVFAPQIFDEALGSTPPGYGRISPRTQLVAQALAVTGSARPDEIDHEEASLFVLEALARDFDDDVADVHDGSRGRHRVNNVCELLAARPRERWRLHTIATELNVSAFHLAREFRSITGTTIGAYILRLRLAAVLDRLASGERSLSRLAAETGFAHHSHLTERFRSVFGITPSVARRGLTRSTFEGLRNILASQEHTSPHV